MIIQSSYAARFLLIILLNVKSKSFMLNIQTLNAISERHRCRLRCNNAFIRS